MNSQLPEDCRCLLIVLGAALALAQPGMVSAQITDRDALMALYTATDGANWEKKRRWGSNNPIGTWYGVTTDADSYVTRLDLSENALSGTIPVELGQLSRLQDLDLSYNGLGGAIPKELGQLSSLQYLYLRGNKLGGPIPVELGSLAQLQHLNLFDNELSGTIPVELGQLANLTLLYLSSNALSGSIPAALGNLSNLVRLSLGDNALSGSIPATLGNLPQLVQLNLYSNALSGSIPTALGNLSDLYRLNLSSNALSGSIPAALGHLSELGDLSLHGNDLTGLLPPELGELSNLTHLKLHSNAGLSGPLPVRFASNLAKLTELQVQNTQVTVPADTALERWLARIVFTSGTRASRETIALDTDKTARGGLWGDDETLYASDPAAAKVFAYSLATGQHIPAKDFALAAENADARGLWADGTTVWVVDDEDARLYAYLLATGQRVPAKDVALAAENADARGLWADGTTAWVVDDESPYLAQQDGPRVFAYVLTTGERVPAKEIDLTSANQSPHGLWADGTTVWVADDEDARLYAYSLATGDWKSDRDEILAPANLTPTGLWSNGTIWWVADADRGRIYRYGSSTLPPPPPPQPPPPRGGGGSGGGGGGGGLLFPPKAPSALVAAAGDGTVRLEWSPPENDGGSPIRRYEYRLKEGRGEVGEWTPIPDSAADEVNDAGFTVSDLLNGTVYAVELRAVNAAGNGRVSDAVEVTMPLDPAYWSNFRAEDLEGVELMLEAFLLEGGSRDRQLRFGEGLRFEEDELDGEGEVTATLMGSYGYRYTSRRTGELSLVFDGGEACELRLTFRGEGTGSYSFRCEGSSRGQGSFGMSEVENRAPEITSTGPFEVEENTERVGQLEAVDWDAEDEVAGYGISGGADAALFAIEAETGELSFREAPDYENPGDVESEDPESPAADNEYILVVKVTSGEGDRERTREQVIRVWVRNVEMEEAVEDEREDETESQFIPVILSSAGRKQSFFTSELTLTNRGKEEVTLDYTYTSRDDPERRSGTASDVLSAGRQKIATNALTYLAGLGIPIPATGNQLGTLRVEAPPGSEVRAVVRTTTIVPDGRAGLAYPGVAEEEGISEPVYLCGLRQNSRDRSNVAFQNMGAPGEGAITLKTTVYSGEATDTSPRELDDITLGPGGFHQFSGPLGTLENGYVKVERVEGEAPFYAYGVINDQANSDGSFIYPVTASSLEGKMGQTLPVIVETRDFTSELTVTNFSQQPRTLDFEFVSEQIKGDEKVVGFQMELEAGEQAIVSELVEALRREEMAKLGSRRSLYLGALFVTAKEGDLSGVVIGARTSSEGGGGQYGVFYNAVPEGEGFARVAWVEGLQQNEENRSNLALVNTGEVDDSPSVFHLEIYNGETGMLEETVVTKAIPARGWHQIDGILLRANPETRQGYIRIEKMSGENPFLAYGVVNDGRSPGERSGDGAYLPARE